MHSHLATSTLTFDGMRPTGRLGTRKPAPLLKSPPVIISRQQALQNSRPWPPVAPTRRPNPPPPRRPVSAPAPTTRSRECLFSGLEGGFSLVGSTFSTPHPLQPRFPITVPKERSAQVLLRAPAGTLGPAKRPQSGRPIRLLGGSKLLSPR